MEKKETELRRLRIAAGIKMEDAIRLTGTPKSTWCYWEWGLRRTPPIAIAWLRLYMERQAKIEEQK